MKEQVLLQKLNPYAVVAVTVTVITAVSHFQAGDNKQHS